MSIATLASDRDISAPSRVRVWVSRFAIRSVATSVGMPVRWPFSSGMSKPRPAIQVPDRSGNVIVDTPTTGRQPVVRQPSQVVEENGVLGSTASSQPPCSLPREDRGMYSQSLGSATHAIEQGLSLRQKIVDVVLVAMWGALIPGVMWLGAMAGF